MPQGFNRAGVAAFVKIASTPGLRPLVVPHIRCKDVRQIPFRSLKERGFKGVVFDKDNTLTAPYKPEFHAPLVPAIDGARRVFGDQLAVLSNSVGSSDDVGFKEADRLERALQLRVVRHGTKKPNGIEAVRALFPGALDDELVFVGDRFFTDILFGNSHGMLTIFVDPFTNKGDNTIVRLIRSAEADLITRWERRGVTAPPHRLLGAGLFSFPS